MEDIKFLRYIRKLVITGIFSDDELMERLVLKGGNLLDIVYELSVRSSVDIDLSMDDEFDDLAKLNVKIRSALQETFDEQGYVIFDFKLSPVPPKLSDDMKDFWGGYRVAFKLIDRDKHARLADSIDDLRQNAANVG